MSIMALHTKRHAISFSKCSLLLTWTCKYQWIISNWISSQKHHISSFKNADATSVDVVTALNKVDHIDHWSLGAMTLILKNEIVEYIFMIYIKNISTQHALWHMMCITKPKPPFIQFPNFAELSNPWLAIECGVHIDIRWISVIFRILCS